MAETITHLGHHPDNEVHRIAFLGGADWSEDSEVYKAAFETAKLLAQDGYENINGGGPGVMRAATKGAHSGGGKALAVVYIPAYKHKNYEGVDPENDYDEEIVTLDYFDRTKVMLQNSDVHVIFRGGTGTISEFGMTWASSRIHQGHHKPIVLFGKFWEHIVKEFKTHMNMREGELELIKICTKPEEVVEYVNEVRALKEGHPHE